MQIGLSIHTLSQSTKMTPSHLERTTISSTKIEDKKSNNPIKFDIRSTEKEVQQPKYEFNELALWKMLKDKGVPLWIILEMLQTSRKEKEAQNSSVQSSHSIEETRLNEIM
ncbi:TPA: DUF3914 domain-containing protein [Bacillus luti]|nr:DUF3914 domain-containing protein [Bacillus luti]HDR7796231.1 DUF3914 domain-containing protein [Bacillus luti]